MTKKRTFRWLRRGALLMVALVALGLSGAYLWLRTSLPQVDGTIRLAGISAPIEIVRDEHAIPHIFAQTPNDGYFGLGFVHAQDRLVQMELMRRLGSGRLAEVVGSAGLGSDRFMRVLGLYRLAEEGLPNLSAETRGAFEAYAAGVNAFIAGNAGAWPPEFYLLGIHPEPWKAADSSVWGKLMAMQLSGNWGSELFRSRVLRRLTPSQFASLWPPYPPTAPVTLAALASVPLERLAAATPEALVHQSASNAWVLAGDRTASGKPILANDPHLGYSAPNLWYLARIETPSWRIAGATVPGVPFHVLGHNGKVAWGMTTTESDTQDLFVERLAHGDSGGYATPAGRAEFRQRQETIRVRGGEDVSLTIRESRHGPILSDVLPNAEPIPAEDGSRYVLALAATALVANDPTPEAIFRINHANDAAALEAALQLFHAPQQNVMYADLAGTIGFLAAGRVPIRAGADTSLPLAGWTDVHDWTGFIPFDRLPRLRNPPDGVLANANNKVVGDLYPFFLTRDWPPAYRARRLEELLAATRKHTMENTAAIQVDSVSLAARDLLPFMVAIVPTNPKAVAVLESLAAWDGTMARDRAEPLIFSFWLRDLVRGLFADELGPLFGDFWDLRAPLVERVLRDDRQWCDDIATPGAETCDQQLRTSFDSAMAEIERRYGADLAGWRWGDAHEARFDNRILSQIPGLGRLANIALPIDGDDFTLLRGRSRIGNDINPFAAAHGPGFRAVYDLSDLASSRFIQAVGQSGNPLSSFYGDLSPLWLSGSSVTLAGTRDDVARRGIGILRLAPK